ncbi:paraquat-inducible membrane protein A [Klebsiella pneumoniae]|uniref:Paraquat-inducible membrane protein A n=1 Tax=Klebsiella pneumoniae TaxID=573 RepID=A0A2X1QHH1_KLEPN|nr:paraquat-inducible membrane protein A [Klebsiella pneumoniae]
MLRDIFYVPNVICWWLCRSLSIARKPPARAAVQTLTTTWDAPRQRPTAYALVALFMLLLANLFPFIYMKVGGISSEIELLEIPNVLFTEDYASLGTFFFTLCSISAGRFAWSPFCCWLIGSEWPAGLKTFLARILFQLKNLGHGGDLFLPACW